MTLITVISSSVASKAPNIHKERNGLMLFSKVLFHFHLATTALLSFACAAKHMCVCTTDAPAFGLLSLPNGDKLAAGAFLWDDS